MSMLAKASQKVIDHGNDKKNSDNYGRNPLNQNFWAEARNFPGVEWIATGKNGLAKRVSRLFKMKDVGSLLLVLKLDGDFDGDINEIV